MHNGDPAVGDVRNEAAGAGERRPRVLFVAETVTLAHFARPLALANALDRARYDVIFACAAQYARRFADAMPPYREIYSISGERFLDALARGAPVYDAATLRRYVCDDLRLIDEVRPDLIVGDFRLSLSVSARLARIPYMAISNAYWSPYAERRIPLPEHPITRIVGLSIAEAAFAAIHPLIFAYHARPLNRVRREHGLPSLGSDLCRVYTDADVTVYTDTDDFIPARDVPPNQVYIGPVLWSPPLEQPQWWSTIGTERPLVYVTLGSSGKRGLLAVVLEALATLACSVVAATAGERVTSAPTNAHLAEYLPGEAIAANASLVVCNGGSPTSQQALAAGAPVLGLASNMDQFMNMTAVARRGAGCLIRAECATAAGIREAAVAMLAEPRYASAARQMAASYARYRPGERFAAVVAETLAATRSRSR